MNRATDLREITETAARAAVGVPGVAHLSPRGTERLRPAALRPPAVGVRVDPRDAPSRTTVEIALAVRSGHQATAVAQSVRTAVLDALHTEHPRVWTTDVSVFVTVTAIV